MVSEQQRIMEGPKSGEGSAFNTRDASNATKVQETTNQRLTSLLLNERNYLPWSRAITIALGGRSKLGHINGKIKAPPMTDSKFDEWQANDHNVMSWIFNSMEPEIYEIFAYSESAKALWDSIYEMYGQAKNASRIFELQQGLACSKQGATQSFTEHLGKMKKQWDELRQYRPATQNVMDYVNREEQDKIFQLLASIRPEFEDTKRQILMGSQLPTFNEVCAIIQSEETRRRVMSSNLIASGELGEQSAHSAINMKQGNSIARFTKGKFKKPARFHCDHCNRDGHSKERCWVLYPHLRLSNDRGPEAKMAIQDNPNDFQSKLEALSQQVQQLLHIHDIGTNIAGTETGNLAMTSGNVHAYSALSKTQFIVDSGATDHMCSSSNFLSNITSGVAYPPITVANGGQVPTSGVGQIKFFSKNSEALLVPELSSNLMSVSKYTNQWNCNVIFTPQKVFFQNRTTKRMIGEG